MSDIIEALKDAVTDACVRHPSSATGLEGTVWNAPLWTALDQIGITLLSVPEDEGGSGGDILAASAVLQVLGEHVAAVPFAETALQAAWLLGACGATIPDGPMAAAVADVGVTLTENGGVRVLEGELTRVPWARHAENLVILVGPQVLVLSRGDFDVRPGSNLAGESRDDVAIGRIELASDRIHTLPDDSTVTAELFAARGAVGRMALMAGAARRSLEMSLTYVGERHQFGRALDKFQAVQHHVAAMAGEVLLCKTAAESAAQALDGTESWQLPVWAGKVATGNAAGTVAKLAHQLHGAIGFTEEHDLRLCTTRIWSWRDEFGTMREMSSKVGDLVIEGGADNLWATLSDGS